MQGHYLVFSKDRKLGSGPSGRARSVESRTLVSRREQAPAGAGGGPRPVAEFITEIIADLHAPKFSGLFWVHFYLTIHTFQLN